MATIVIELDNRCNCNCAGTCPLDKVASMIRCTKEELENAGYKTIINPDKLSFVTKLLQLFK